MKIRSGVWLLHVRAHGRTLGLFWLVLRWDTDLPKTCLGKWGEDMEVGLNGFRRCFWCVPSWQLGLGLVEGNLSIGFRGVLLYRRHLLLILFANSSLELNVRFSSINYCVRVMVGARCGVVFKALPCKPAGRKFDSWWCYWNFSVT